MIQVQGGYEWKVFLINVCGVGSESWVTNDEVIWFLSRGEFVVDTIVLCG